ncbi:MAG: hypothetical protein WKH97_20125 [Casimicrobiaceae bacterium]
MNEHWLLRPASIRTLWGGFIAILLLVLLAALPFGQDAHFAFERLFGFYALFGFVACAALIVLAKAIGVLLKRSDTYYGKDRDV